MKTISILIAFTLLLAACKETKVTPLAPMASVTGKLLYRSSCMTEGAPVAFTPPNSGAGDVGPYLYLSDLAGKIVSAPVTTRLDGSFVIPRVPVGSYQLRLRAQELRNFWVGAPVATLAVTVSGTANVAVGTLCADNDKPRADAVLASWGDAVTMTATRGHTLHLEAASVETRLDVLGSDPDGDLLQANFRTGSGDLRADASLTAHWPHTAGVLRDSLRVLVTDGFGGNITLELPVRLHQNRLLPLFSGTWSDFSDAATVASFEKMSFYPADATDAGWMQNEAGLTAKFPAASTEAGFMMLASPASFDLTSKVATEVRFNVVQTSADWMVMAGIRSELGGLLLGLALRSTPAGFEWRISDGDQNILNEGSLEGFSGTQIAMRLELDPVLGTVTGTLRSETQDDIQVSASVEPMEPVSVTPLLIVAQMDSGATLELDFSELYAGKQTNDYVFPSLPGTLGDLLYDQHPVAGRSGSFVIVNDMTSFGAETITVTLDQAAPMAMGLVRYFSGERLTMLTDFTEEEAREMGLAVDSWDADAAFPLEGNNGILY